MYHEHHTEFETQSAGPAMSPEIDYDTMPIPLQNGQSRLPLMICVVLTILLLVEVGFFVFNINAIRQERTRYLPDAQTTMEKQNEPFEFGPKQREITIKEVEDMGWQEGMVKGYKLVRVNCLLGYQDENLYKWQSGIYLQTDGVYYPAVDRYELEQLNPQLMLHALQTYNIFHQSMDEGWMYFIVPKDAAEGTIWLNAVEQDEDYVTVNVQATGVPVVFEKGETDNA